MLLRENVRETHVLMTLFFLGYIWVKGKLLRGSCIGKYRNVNVIVFIRERCKFSICLEKGKVLQSLSFRAGLLRARSNWISFSYNYF